MNFKTLSLLFSLLLSISLVFSACSDKSDPDPITPSMSATVTTPVVGNSDFTATTVVASVSGNLLNISGAATGKSLTLSLTNDGTVGVRNITTTGPTFATYIEGTNSYTGTTGTVDIDTWDTSAKTITGTFSFTAQTGIGTTKNLSEGSFAATY